MRRTILHHGVLSLVLVYSLFCSIFQVALVNAESCMEDETCANPDQINTAAASSNREFQVKFLNKSGHRVDVHWDDGKYGNNLATLEPNGGTGILNTFRGHSFFVTRHGVSEALFDPSTDTKLRFESSGPGDLFIIPEDAEPSSDLCQDRYSVCEQMALSGQCTGAPGWMIVHCCKSCDKELDSRRLIDPKVRCSKEHLNITEPVWKPGDLNNLFTKWATSDMYKPWDPVVLASPGAEYGGIDGPWVITFDNFFTDKEADALVRGGRLEGFKRSTDQGAVGSTGEMQKVVSTGRTSSNAWCMHKCESIPEVRAVSRKIELATSIPKKNYESFQILEYGNNQFYKSHHDSRAKDDRPAGPRILTFFLYLSDVEEGGETHFNKLDISVKPKKGRALVWPSVSNDNPAIWDPRTFHEAKPVIKGKKYAANHWIHLNDFMGPNKWGCTGSFS